MLNRQSILFSIGVLTYTVFSFITFQFNPGFAGAQADSYFYFKMFNYIKLQQDIIPLNDYQVATSPIFVSLIGGLQILCGSLFTEVLHFLYLCFATASIYFFVKILNSNNFFQTLPLVVLFSSSGYFIAPSIWPTSDAPAILFAILTIYMYQRGKNLGFATVSFLLVSTRQNFAWLLLAFFIYDCFADMKFVKVSVRKVSKYFPALLSLLITFNYFDGHLSTPSYLSGQLQSSYPLPNFLNSIQIGITSISILGVVVLVLNRNRLTLNLRRGDFLILFGFAIFPFGFLISNSMEPIIEGLGWISLLSLQLHVSLLVISLIASIGLALTIFLALQNDNFRFTLPISMFASLLLSTLLMPIPFLRYFEFAVILIASMLISDLNGKLLPIGARKYFALVVFFLSLNALKILN